jgi:NADH:ubiquinone oxidoreductase subunit E
MSSSREQRQISQNPKNEESYLSIIGPHPKTNKQHDSIMVVVEKLTKAAHFVPVKTTHTTANIIEIFMKEIARLHGIPGTIV